MEKRKFLSDLIFVQGLNLLVKIVWILIIDRAVQNLLHDYGLYYRLLSLSILFVIVLDLGLNNMNSRLVAGDQRFFNTNFVAFLRAKILLAGAYLVILAIGATALKLTPAQWQILGVLGLFQVVNSINLYLRSNLSAMHYFKLDGVLAIADRLLVIIVCGAWLYVPGLSHMLTIQNFALVQLGGVSATLLIGLLTNIRHLDTQDKLEVSEKVKGLIRSSLPYALLIALMAIFTRVDALMIGYFIGDGETDRYAMSYRLLDAANMMAALFSGMLLPMFARVIQQPKQISEIAGIASRVLILPAFFMALLLAPHAGEILSLMYPNKQDAASSGTFVWLLFSFIASASVFVFGTLLTAANKLRYLNTVALISATGNILLNLALIPTMGIEGAALATFATQMFFALACFVKSYREFNFSPNRHVALKFGVSVAAFGAVFYFTKQFLQNSFVHISVGVILSALLVVGSGMISPDVLKKLSRRKTQEASDN